MHDIFATGFKESIFFYFSLLRKGSPIFKIAFLRQICTILSKRVMEKRYPYLKT